MSAPPLIRRSPVRLPGAPAEVERRAGWEVVLAYEGEGAGPWLVDLSHRARWDYQDRQIGDRRPFDLDVPAAPGQVSRGGDLLIARMNRTQASIWHVGPGSAPAMPAQTPYTDTTDSNAWLALIGEETPAVLERATSLDLFGCDASHPRLIQGPVLHIPCQIVVWTTGLAFLAFSRGYGQPFVDALFDVARDTGLRAAGEQTFTRPDTDDPAP